MCYILLCPFTFSLLYCVGWLAPAVTVRLMVFALCCKGYCICVIKEYSAGVRLTAIFLFNGQYCQSWEVRVTVTKHMCTSPLFPPSPLGSFWPGVLFLRTYWATHTFITTMQQYTIVTSRLMYGRLQSQCGEMLSEELKKLIGLVFLYNLLQENWHLLGCSYWCNLEYIHLIRPTFLRGQGKRITLPSVGKYPFLDLFSVKQCGLSVALYETQQRTAKCLKVELITMHFASLLSSYCKNTPESWRYATVMGPFSRSQTGNYWTQQHFWLVTTQSPRGYTGLPINHKKKNTWSDITEGCDISTFLQNRGATIRLALVYMLTCCGP